MYTNQCKQTKKKWADAIELLLTNPPDQVARQLGVRMGTLRRWMEQTQFQEGLRLRCRERREAAGRIVVSASLAAAMTVESAIRTGEDKGQAKTALDLLKSSGLLNFTDTSAADDQLAELVRLIDQEEAE